MPGVILELRAGPGDRVTAGETLVVMEAMKMEHHISAPEDGTITEVLVAVGQQVENGTALMVLEPDEDSS
jgi:propionyl-CoA carboxylase alpha chain